MNCLFGTLTLLKSRAETHSYLINCLFSKTFRSKKYISSGNLSALGVPKGFDPPEKFAASRLEASVLILVNFAPLRSLAGVKAFTVAITAVSVDKILLTV